MKNISILSMIILLLLSISFSINSVNASNPGEQQEHRSFNPDIETQKYLNTLTRDQKEKSDAYFEGGYWINLWNFLAQVIIAWIFLSLGLSGWIKNIAQKVRYADIQNFLYTIFYFVFAFLMTLPLNIYAGFFREHKYGLSNMRFTGWFTDQIKELILTVIIGGIFIAILYAIIRRVKKNWWIWGFGFTSIFLIFLLLIQPVSIAPIFNKYRPLENNELREEILSLARANGVPADNVYEFNASKQSNRISANVSGIGSTIRISLNDNLLNQCTPAEIMSVMGHEIGHYVLNHIYKLIFFYSVIIFLCFAFVNWSFNKLSNRFKSKWRISGIDDIAGLPLLIILFTTFLFFSNPITNTISRTIEIEADLYGINASREPDGHASIETKLSSYRKLDPSPLEEFLFYDHPAGKARILLAMRWKAENLDNE